MHRHMGIELVLLVVPIQLFARIGHPVGQIAHPHAASQFPQRLIVPIGRIGGDVEVHIEPVVVALEQHPFAKFLTRRVGAVKHQPLFGEDLVAHHSRIADELRNAVGDHHRERVAVANRRAVGRGPVVASRKGQSQCEKREQNIKKTTHGANHSTFHLSNHFSPNDKPMDSPKNCSFSAPVTAGCSNS